MGANQTNQNLGTFLTLQFGSLQHLQLSAVTYLSVTIGCACALRQKKIVSPFVMAEKLCLGVRLPVFIMYNKISLGIIKL